MAVASAEECLRALLVSTTNVTSIVSTRIRPHLGAQADTAPYLTFQRIATERFNHYAGPDDLVAPLIQINGWSTSVSQLATLRNNVRITLNGQMNLTVIVGTAPNTTTASVSAIWLHDDRDALESPFDGSDQPIFGFEQDYKVFHKEALTI